MENKRVSISISDIIEKLRTKYMALLTVDINGNIVNVMFWEKKPSLEEEFKIVKEISEKFKGCCGVYILNDNKLSPKTIRTQIAGAVEALEYARKNKLKSGSNIPDPNS